MFRQVPDEWEVINVYTVEPVPVDNHGATILRLAPHEITGTYIFDMASPAPASPPRTPNKSSSPTRPPPPGHQSAPTRVSMERRVSEASTSSSTSSSPLPSSSKRSPMNSIISFLRTHSNSHKSSHPQHHYNSSSSSASSSSLEEDSLSGSEASILKESVSAPQRCQHHPTSASASSTELAGPSRRGYKKSDVKRALMAARGELMKQVELAGRNGLVSEGWSVTILRQAARYRIRIEYVGRPAVISYQQEEQTSRARKPPFLEMVDAN